MKIIDIDPSNANGAQIPYLSDKAPLINKRAVPPPNCNVNIIPNVFPSMDSCVASETNEKRAGYVKNVDMPKSIIIKINMYILVKYVNKRHINPNIK